jgi:hypothetical protein
MSGSRSVRLEGVRRRAIVTVTMSLVLPLIAMASASAAMAEPQGIFSRFKECPTEFPGLALCNVAYVTGGELVIGNARIPINKTITIQSGGIPTGNPANSVEYFLLPAKNGETLSKTELNLPAVNCQEIRGNGFFQRSERALCKATLGRRWGRGITATIEVAANEHNPAIFNELALTVREGTALTLPVRVHLKGPLLGSACYVGSEAEPIQLHLSTGTSGKVTGRRGEFSSEEENELGLLHITQNALVDNTFAVPAAQGCGAFLFLKDFLDPLLDEKLGLPSAAGDNTAVLDDELYATSAEEVIANEKL